MSIDITGKRVYLSGPMTGIEDYNRPAFDGADLDLLGAGADEVYDPAEHIDEYAQLSHEQCMALSLCELIAERPWVEEIEPYYDVLVSLPGWQDSAGARLEREVAAAIGMEVHDLGEVL